MTGGATVHEAVRAQRSAARPEVSAWVSANAGSGKTRVLTERVARLLLDGAPPAKILCLTFTKAAAAEMQSRLFAMLGGWTMAEDETLAEALAGLSGGGAFGADALDRSRRLFAEALETPGGLKIQTIHAFCDGLLRRFPLEAGAPPGFRVMEDVEQEEIIRETLDALARDEASDGAAAFRGIVDLLNEDDAFDRAKDAVSKRDLFASPPDEAAICRAFGVAAPPDRDAAREAAIRRLDLSRLTRMIAAWAQGAKTDQERAAALAAAQATGDGALVDGLISGLLTKDLAPRKTLASKGAQAAEPDHEAICAHLVEATLAAVEAENAAVAADRSLRIHRFGNALVRRYEAAKAAHGLLDFDDLVGKARDLLTRSEACDWVLYRLDGGVDHILVDEAQDTSRRQWDVIDAIAKEFRAGAGAGARDAIRTSFVVGDEKQSIYRFQGAAPEMFDEMRRAFAKGLTPHGGQVEEELAFSFRSAPAILKAVDATFAADRATGLSAAGAAPRHAAFRDARAGRVELWPLVSDDQRPDPPEAWAPVDAPSPRSARAKLAEMVAERVKDMVAGERLPGGGRRVRPSDVLILLPAREPFMRTIVRGLKARGVPVAGADRLTLTAELAVKDLLALLAFATTPEDDLSLACVLRSPLFGFSEDDLFLLAHGRKGTLWRALRGAADRHAEAVGRLEKLLGRGGFERPYELLETALVEWNGRRRFMERLGRQADDAIDELLAQAIVFEETETPTVEAFLARMTASDMVIKREQEGRGGEVRVMSAHGAKGLEAPIVILPDTTRKDRGQRGWSIARLSTDDGEIAAMPAGKRLDPALLVRARDREAAEEEAEKRRLLYVAMTRAEDWLIVAGAGEDDESGGKLEGTWYGMVRAGLESLSAAPSPSPAGDGLVHASGAEPKPEDDEGRAPSAAPTGEAAVPLPPPPPRKRGERRTASALGGEPEPGGGLAPELAARRGEAIHAVLEAGATDPAEAARLVAPFGLEEAFAAQAVAEAIDARALPEAARFFAEEAVAEAGVAVVIGETRVVGRIDRLVVSPEAVAFVDFKSDARPPDPGVAPDDYLAQLAAYRAALAGIYPGRRIEAHLLWTAAPRLERIADDALDRAAAAAFGLGTAARVSS